MSMDPMEAVGLALALGVVVVWVGYWLLNRSGEGT